jgi:nitrite reductase/ring-hydroxylating ferredoxin subunit/enamine deaminase RidA (YjgF/YER057c/UK114 family)
MVSDLPVVRARAGEVIGRPFLDGRIIAFRDEHGDPKVLSAYCPHMGADLAAGKVVGSRVTCAFHKWEYDGGGVCRRTGIGDPPPKNARLFRFPCVEKFGLVWAFNGHEPWWQIPDFPIPEAKLAIDVRYDPPLLPVDPWVVCANTPDWQHIKIVHHVDFDSTNLFKRIKWTDHSMEYSFRGRMTEAKDEEVDYNVGIFGTSMFHIHGTRNGQWFAILNAFGLPQPGVTQKLLLDRGAEGRRFARERGQEPVPAPGALHDGTQHGHGRPADPAHAQVRAGGDDEIRPGARAVPRFRARVSALAPLRRFHSLKSRTGTDMAKNSQVQFLMEPIERELGFAALVQQGNTLWLSGLIAVDENLQIVGKGDMAAQITQIYYLMEKVLAMSQATLEHVVSEVMYTTDLQASSQRTTCARRATQNGRRRRTRGCRCRRSSCPKRCSRSRRRPCWVTERELDQRGRYPSLTPRRVATHTRCCEG